VLNDRGASAGAVNVEDSSEADAVMGISALRP